MAEGEAEVERQHLLDVEHELHGQRAIEPEALAELRHVLGRGRACFAGEHLRRIAGGQVQQQEVEDQDGEDDGHRLEEPADHVRWPAHRSAHVVADAGAYLSMYARSNEA